VSTNIYSKGGGAQQREEKEAINYARGTEGIPISLQHHRKDIGDILSGCLYSREGKGCAKERKRRLERGKHLAGGKTPCNQAEEVGRDQKSAQSSKKEGSFYGTSIFLEGGNPFEEEEGGGERGKSSERIYISLGKGKNLMLRKRGSFFFLSKKEKGGSEP